MLYIANDHAGYRLKIKLIKFLSKTNIKYKDMGTYSEDSVDFPVFCKLVTNEVDKNSNDKGILICGTGIGMSICANRNPQIRAALCNSPQIARLARQHNNANILVLAGRFTSGFMAKRILKAFLNTTAFDGKYKTRMEEINE